MPSTTSSSSLTAMSPTTSSTSAAAAVEASSAAAISSSSSSTAAAAAISSSSAAADAASISPTTSSTTAMATATAAADAASISPTTSSITATATATAATSSYSSPASDARFHVATTSSTTAADVATAGISSASSSAAADAASTSPTSAGIFTPDSSSGSSSSAASVASSGSSSGSSDIPFPDLSSSSPRSPLTVNVAVWSSDGLSDVFNQHSGVPNVYVKIKSVDRLDSAVQFIALLDLRPRWVCYQRGRLQNLRTVTSGLIGIWTLLSTAISYDLPTGAIFSHYQMELAREDIEKLGEAESATDMIKRIAVKANNILAIGRAFMDEKDKVKLLDLSSNTEQLVEEEEEPKMDHTLDPSPEPQADKERKGEGSSDCTLNPDAGAKPSGEESDYFATLKDMMVAVMEDIDNALASPVDMV